MAAYSLDLRKRVLGPWDRGMDAESVAAKFAKYAASWCLVSSAFSAEVNAAPSSRAFMRFAETLPSRGSRVVVVFVN
jgi:hypothetical protein